MRRRLRNVRRLALRPGDRVIWEADPGEQLTAEQVDRIREALEQEFAPHQVLVLVGGRLKVQTGEDR